MRAQLAGTTILRKICVAATILLAVLLMLEVRKRDCEGGAARLVEAIGTPDAVLRSGHGLGLIIEIASYLLWRDATAAHGRLTPGGRRLVVPLPPVPFDDPRLGNFADTKA